MLRALLNERFFNSCLVHEESKKNEENNFCMDCCLSLCFHCLLHHQSHTILQIRRYMYNDVLRLKDAQKIFDSSNIQSFTTNGEKVVLLRPRQLVSYPIRVSRCTCLVCNQNTKSSFGYCSMVCKFSNVTSSSCGKDVERSLPVSGSTAESLVSMESAAEENSTMATTDDAINYESVAFMEEVHLPDDQKRSTTSSNVFTRNLHGRKCVPQRSPLF